MQTMKRSTVNRWYWRCADCLSVVAVESELKRPYCNTLCRYRSPECGLCGGSMESMGRVERSRLVHDTERCACDARCTGATGPNCECACGGENHGTGRTVTVQLDAGAVPRLMVPDSHKARAIAAEWREMLGALVAERDSIADRKAREWIPRPAWDRWHVLCRVIAHAHTLTSHAGRMKAIRSVASDVGERAGRA